MTPDPSIMCKLCSLQVSHSFMSDSLQSHESQLARPPCPPPTPRVYPNSCPLSQWCHPAIPSSVVPFSSCPLSLPTSGVFSNESTLLMRWPKYLSFSFIIISSKGHPGLISFRMEWLDLLAVQGNLMSLLQHQQFKSINSLVLSFLHSPTLTSIHDYWKTIALTRRTFVGKVMSLLLNMLSRAVIKFHVCNHHLQWFWNPKIKVWHCFHCFPIYFPWSDGTRCHDVRFLNVEL